MADELAELSRANPVRPHDVRPMVSMSWQEAAALLEADADGGRPAAIRLTSRRLGGRAGYSGLVALAACLALFAALGLGSSRPPVEDRLVDAADGPQTSTLVVTPSHGPVGKAPNKGTASGQGETDAARATTQTTAPQPDTEATQLSSQTQQTEGVARPSVNGPLDPTKDLLVVHLDFADTDDGVTAAAVSELTRALHLDPLVVVATPSADSEEYVHPYNELMMAVWGDRWVDARSDRETTVAGAANQWLEHLDAGGHIWVAEGGVSDFTAEVLEQVSRQRPGMDTKSVVHVVQHNDRNERATRFGALETVKATTDYVQIDDGNSANGTADLKQVSEEFEQAAIGGDNGAVWQAVFDYRPPSDLDFSDTVTVLHIVGVGVDQVADPAQFADYFMR